MQRMKNQIEQLQAELLYVKGDSSTPYEELQILKQKIALFETSNADLQKQLQEHRVNFEHLTKQAIDAQILKQKIALFETSNADLQKQLQEHQVNFEHLTKQAIDAQNSQANQMEDQDANKDFRASVEFLLNSQGDNNNDVSSKVISKVPSRLRALSNKSFNPRVVSIGPLHREKNLKISEGPKKTYIRDLLSRLKLPSEETLEACLGTIYDSKDKIKQCYVETEFNDDVELARMMVMDACFILEFSYKCSEKKVNVLLAQSIFVDLLLVENQIPLFVLNDIFNLTILKSPPDETVLIDLETFPTDKTSLIHRLRPILEFGNLFRLKLRLREHSARHNHILGILYACYLPTYIHESIVSGYDHFQIHNVVELDKAGVNFKPNKGNERWPMTMEVKSSWCGWFSWFCGRPTITMPVLLLTEFTELMLRNLIAYEQKCDLHFVASYAMALDMIVDSEEDIAMLVKSQVMINVVGSNKEAAKMVNSICKEVAIADFFYINEWEKLLSYCNKPWPKYIAWLKRTYFNNPWNIIALLAGIMLFALTTVQTYFTAVQTCFSDSNK